MLRDSESSASSKKKTGQWCFHFAASESPYWNIILLALAWALTLSTSTLLTAVGPLSAKELGASKSLSAFTIGAFLIGAAISSVPSGWLFRKYGRFWGFALGCLFQLIGSFLGVLSLATNQLFWLYLGCLSIGLAQGLGQFYRFSAVEVTPAHLKSRAVTYVLSGGIIAAFLGPSSATYSMNFIGERYMGSYAVVAIFAAFNLFVITFVDFPPPISKDVKTWTANPMNNAQQSADAEKHTDQEMPVSYVNHEEEEVRSALQIARQPQFILSCTIATLAHTIMVMLMSNVTLDMGDNGYGFNMCSLTMELHFFAMFSPGFISGKFIEHSGTFIVALVGGFIFAGSSVVLALGTDTWNYILGMILLGVAWNFSFSAGTVMLTGCYKPKEATEVQAVNDFVLFSVAGAGSLISGYVYSAYGWLVLVYFSSGLMFVYLMLFGWALTGVKDIHEDKDGRQPLLISVNSVSSAVANKLQQDIDREVEDHRSSSIDYHSRGKSFSDHLHDTARSLSISFRIEATAEHVDELTPLRTQSVA